MASDKGVAQCSEAVVNYYGVTFAGLGASLEKLNTKQEALSSAMQREGRAAQRGSGGSQCGADDQCDQHLQDKLGAGGDGGDNCEVSEDAAAGGKTPGGVAAGEYGKRGPA